MSVSSVVDGRWAVHRREREALQALAKIDSAEVIPILTRKLDSPIREFRYLAAEALWPRGYKRSVRVFISDLRSDDREIRKWADRRLEKLTGITSDYWYGDPESDREKNVRWWEAWLTKQKR